MALYDLRRRLDKLKKQMEKVEASSRPLSPLELVLRGSKLTPKTTAERVATDLEKVAKAIGDLAKTIRESDQLPAPKVAMREEK